MTVGIDRDILGATEGGGWLVNITRRGLRLRPELEAYVVTPTTLQRVWAGDDPGEPDVTVALRFDDEAAAAALGLDG